MPAKLPTTITIPAAIDLHVHLREPGLNKAETIASGTKAALLGGYGLVCDMPNNPGSPIWSKQLLDKKQAIIKRTAYIPVATYAGSQPESNNLDELVKMAPTSIGLKLYGAPTTGNHQDYTAAQFADIVSTWHTAAPKKPIMLHAGQANLQDFISLIAKKHRHPLHLCHVNSAGDVAVIKKAKQKGLPVTCGVCPHHLFKTSHDELSEGWFARMQPPLARQSEAEELFKLFVSGDIDILETDHAPHSPDAKLTAESENPRAIHDANHTTCFGVAGIEFALPLLLYQVKTGRLKLSRLIQATSTKPAKIIGIKLDKRDQVTWSTEQYRIGTAYPKGLSKAGWTPYLDKLAVGRVEQVKIGGKTLVKKGKILAKLPKVVI